MTIRTLVLLSSLIVYYSTSALAQNSSTYDLVIQNGRVIDPETNLDEVRNIGIWKGRIAIITGEVLEGSEVINAGGLVVAPGFIDLHVHGISNTEQKYQVHDGVTTALELEAGVPFPEAWHQARRDKALINFGASASWPHARAAVMDAFKDGYDKLREAIEKGGWSQDQITRSISLEANYTLLEGKKVPGMLEYLKADLEKGAIGIAVPVGYLPAASREEVFRVYQFASEQRAPIFTHVRPGNTLAVQQAIADAAVTGAPLHIVHINSMALGEIELAIEMVQAAQKRGLDITTELYPYTAGSTNIASARFDPGWQEDQGITFGDLQWVETGERLTEKTFKKYRQQGGWVIIHKMKPAWIRAGIASEGIIIASDGMPFSPSAHPRTAGTFARVLGKYVREERVISLPQAIGKMTLLPARRLEGIAPMMRFKGRIQVGCDADITILDPKRVIDRATYDGGLEFSEGIEYVLVNGVMVVRNGNLVEEVFPGQPVYGKYKK